MNSPPLQKPDVAHLLGEHTVVEVLEETHYKYAVDSALWT